MKTVSIVGGGLAGLTLGLRLRQLGVPVELFEAGSYPRHRVCGEYLSGRGRECLHSLIPDQTWALAGARCSTGLQVFRGSQRLGGQTLPRPALCLSRHRLDQLLADHLVSNGGRLHLQTRQKLGTGEGWISATGRQPVVQEEGWRWIGLKVHALDLPMGEDLEMHLTPYGYVGLCAVEGNRVNVCGLFRTRETVPDLAQQWPRWLSGPTGSVLQQRLRNAHWDESSFSCVSAISLRPRRAAQQSGVRVGDAVTMIPPLTGNGMSMAVEGSFLAADPLAEWSRGEIDWAVCSRRVAQRLDLAFSSRLAWAYCLQQTILHPWGQPAAWHLSRLFPPLPQLLFHLTR